MDRFTKIYNELKKACNDIGHKYELTLFQNMPDNVFSIIQAAEPTDEEKMHVWDLYHDYLFISYRED